MRRALVFDFDGTLADSREAAFRIYHRLAPEFGMRPVPPEEVASLRHLNLRALRKSLGIRKRDVPSLLRRGRALMREEVGRMQPCAGVFEELEKVRGKMDFCGILTSNSVENVEIFLRRHGFRRHFDFISSCRKLTGKAKMLKAIARSHAIDPAEMIYVGDEVRDVRACQKARVPVAAVAWGFHSMEALRASGPDWLLEDPGELGRLLAARLDEG